MNAICSDEWLLIQVAIFYFVGGQSLDNTDDSGMSESPPATLESQKTTVTVLVSMLITAFYSHAISISLINSEYREAIARNFF